MFLKRVEIIGFKSFAERIGIDFVPGVTAVVGPNGSGKSNITDAIRWVLGEQSAKSLRGSKMEDVIFAGSDSRKPLNFAEVTLILDNSKNLFPLDYTEISVTRRVFRSGESVYLLNGQQCRLKDINNVFIDSGLGKDAFSIISQGRVDEILNSRPEDRRSIFDEAAGVLKYRNRKRKAEHKLFETSDNLDRVLDILKELDIRIEPLKVQAEAAENHALLTAQFEELDVRLLNYDAENLRKELEKKLIVIKKLEEEKEQLQMTVEEEETALQVVRDDIIAKERKLESLQEEFVQISTAGEMWEGRRLLSEEKHRNATKQLERLQNDIKQSKEKEQHLAEQVQRATSNLTSLKESYERVVNEIQETNKMLQRSVKETEEEIDHLKSVYIDYLNEEATIRNDLKHIEERIQGESYSAKKIVDQHAKLEEKLKEAFEEREKHEKKLQKSNQLFNELNAHYEKNEKTLKQYEADLNEKQQLMQQAHNRQHEMQGRLRALQSLEADFSGFFTGVKEVLQARERNELQGIEGAVAELITMDQNYIKAVETALGGAMQHIVTHSEKNAREAIQFLKTRNKGRATFLPKDVIRPRNIPSSVLKMIENHTDYVGIAAHLVEVKPAFKHIIDNLLGNVIVSKSLIAATDIAKSVQYRYRIVTLDGDIVNAGGSLTGGGTKNRASFFSRKAELEQLIDRVEKMTASIQRGEQLIRDVKMKIAKYMQKTEQSKQQCEAQQLESNAIQSTIREYELTIRTLESEMAMIEAGKRGAESIGSQLMNEQTILKEKHHQIRQKIGQIQEEVETLERLAKDWRNEEATLTAKQSSLRERAAILREQIAYEKKEIEQLEKEQALLIQQQNQLHQERTYLEDGDEEQMSAEQIASQIEQAQRKKTEIEQALIIAREERIKAIKQSEQLEIAVKELREQNEGINKQLQTATVDFSRMEVKFETIANRLLDDYGLRTDPSIVGELDEESSRRELKELQSELTRIGPINPGAVQEYEEVSERYQFLTDQRNDLLEAKETLQSAMAEMDNEMVARFSTTFDAIQHQFRRVFKEMFGGGNADLILTNPSDLLHTGVDIIARPPGKKMQSLSLLSGGERALTAISLLFSIIEVRPVPFCILDEVEAALDEANVLRYSDYLKRFSNRTQFIVITHRKGTMEGADVLYGITMQESGVSKVISVKLSEVPEEAMM